MYPASAKVTNFNYYMDAPMPLEDLCSYYSQLNSSQLQRIVTMYKTDSLLFDYSYEDILYCQDEYYDIGL